MLHKPPSAGQHVPRWLFLRLLGLVHVAAFGSFLVQAHGLVGEQGIVPISETMATLADSMSWAQFPGLHWLAADDLALTVLGWSGIIGGVALTIGAAPRALLGLLWLLYLTVFHVGGPFLSFQWDLLLLEVTLLAIPYAPAGLWPKFGKASPPSRWATWLLRLVLFKLMFSSGVVKMNHADPTWESLTALNYHYWTQPIPHGLAWWAHQLPDWAQKLSVSMTLVIELVLPWLVIFNPRRWRLAGFVGLAAGLVWMDSGVPTAVTVATLAVVAALLDDRVLHRITPRLVPEPAPGGGARVPAFVGFLALMLAISFTGNYGFFQVLTVALCLPLLDDGLVWRLTPARLADRWPNFADRTPGPVGRGLAVALMAVFAVLSTLTMVSLLGRDTLKDAFAADQSGDASALQAAITRTYRLRQSVLDITRPFATINGYGLFASMTTQRFELQIEGSADTKTWTPYTFRYKPDGPADAPPLIGVHMPRLDWQMWFAALGNTCPRRGWLVSLQRRLLEGSPAVLGLLESDPFPDAPPRWVRIRRSHYTFADAATRAATGHFWTVTEPTVWCAPISLKDFRRRR